MGYCVWLRPARTHRTGCHDADFRRVCGVRFSHNPYYLWTGDGEKGFLFCISKPLFLHLIINNLPVGPSSALEKKCSDFFAKPHEKNTLIRGTLRDAFSRRI